jgi:hypothetical protein
MSSGHGAGVHSHVPLPRVAVGQPWCIGPAVRTIGSGGLARRATTTPAAGAVLAVVAIAIIAIAIFVVILGPVPPQGGRDGVEDCGLAVGDVMLV